MAFLEVKGLEAFYGKAQALHGITFSMEKGECIGIIGPNGAGKSTLLSSILGLVDCRGQIIFDGEDTRKRNTTKVVRLGIGYAPERGNIFGYMNVRDNLLVGGYTSRDEIAENLEKVYELFPILKERQRQQAGTLSGGQRQMLSLGRVFMTSPKLMLLDEPTLGLAPIVITQIAQAIEGLKGMGFTVLIAEQNALFTLNQSDRIYLMERGKFTMEGKPEDLKDDEYISSTYFGI